MASQGEHVMIHQNVRARKGVTQGKGQFLSFRLLAVVETAHLASGVNHKDCPLLPITYVTANVKK